MGLVDICKGALLSQYNICTGTSTATYISLSNPSTQVISVVATARLRYSASVELMLIVGCFFYFHESKESPSLTL